MRTKRMGPDTRVQEEIEKILDSLKGMERLEAGPAFAAQLRARISALDAAGRRRLAPWALLRPALLALLVLANLLTLAAAARSLSEEKRSERAAIQAMAADYDMEVEADPLAGAGKERER